MTKDTLTTITIKVPPILKLLILEEIVNNEGTKKENQISNAIIFSSLRGVGFTDKPFKYSACGVDSAKCIKCGENTCLSKKTTQNTYLVCKGCKSVFKMNDKKELLLVNSLNNEK